MTLIATSPTIERIEKIINDYFYSTSYSVNRDTLEVTNSKGTLNNFSVLKEKKRYKFYQL